MLQLTVFLSLKPRPAYPFHRCRFFIVGDEGGVLLVTDPDTMSQKKYVESGTTRSLYGVTRTGSKLVAVSNYGTIMASP